jgi:hypothetical protein
MSHAAFSIPHRRAARATEPRPSAVMYCDVALCGWSLHGGRLEPGVGSPFFNIRQQFDQRASPCKTFGRLVEKAQSLLNWLAAACLVRLPLLSMIC